MASSRFDVLLVSIPFVVVLEFTDRLDVLSLLLD